MQGARKIINYYGRKSIIGKFASLKNKSTIYFESLLEQDFIYLLETDITIISYASQPLTVEYFAQGKTRKYTPDFIVRTSNMTEIVEVKPKKYLDKYVPLYEAVRPVFFERGWDFRVITEENIRLEPRLYNAKLLCRYANYQVNPNHYAACMSIIRVKNAISLKELSFNLAQYDMPPFIIYNLLLRDELTFNKLEKLSSYTIIKKRS